jgi:hypothetical protein
MHNFYGIRAKANSFRKGYLIDSYDQPTYLSFALDFGFDSTNASIQDDLLWSSPLFQKGNETRANSAQTYLGSIGHEDKEKNLLVFNDMMRYLTFEAPWYFQSISGLSSLWKGATDTVGGYKGKDATITVETLEAIDLRMTEIASLYRNAIYDKAHMRARVPDNLRWFTMDIYIAEARNIRMEPTGPYSNMTSALGINTGGVGKFVTNLSAAASQIDPSLDLASPMKQFGFVRFKCRQCEFDFSESFTSNDLGVSPKSTPNTGKFKINIGYFEEESEYQDGTKMYDDATINSIKNPWSARNTAAIAQNVANSATFLPVIGDDLQRFGQKSQDKLKTIGGLINPALNAAFIKTPPINLGNIYK